MLQNATRTGFSILTQPKTHYLNNYMALLAMSPLNPFSYFAGLIALTTASPLKTSLTPRDTGSSTIPYCFYNQGCGTICWGRPLESNCDTAITATCTALVSVQAGNHTQLATRIGSGVSDGDNADCVASAANGNNPPPDMNTCIQHFQMIQGCFMTTNQGYGANCVGGNINVPFCTTVGGPIDSNVPTYGLGTPTQLGLTSVSYSPPGTAILERG